MFIRQSQLHAHIFWQSKIWRKLDLQNSIADAVGQRVNDNGVHFCTCSQQSGRLCMHACRQTDNTAQRPQICGVCSGSPQYRWVEIFRLANRGDVLLSVRFVIFNLPGHVYVIIYMPSLTQVALFFLQFSFSSLKVIYKPVCLQNYNRINFINDEQFF